MKLAMVSVQPLIYVLINTRYNLTMSSTVAQEFEKMVEASPDFQNIFLYDNFRLQPVLDAKAQTAFIRPNERLAHALRNSIAQGLPPISVLPMAAQQLSVLVKMMGAKSVLEIGTLGKSFFLSLFMDLRTD